MTDSIGSLGGSLMAAAEYAVAKVVSVGLISCDSNAVREIARETTKAVLGELISREAWLHEVTPKGEITTTSDEHWLRIVDYRTAVADLEGPSDG
jgi:hypothetical protein